MIFCTGLHHFRIWVVRQTQNYNMGELHSIAYSNSVGSLHGSSLGWNFQSLGVLNAEMSSVIEEASPFMSTAIDQSDFSSTGYLEDVLLEFSESSKRRRRLLLYSDNDLAKSYWERNWLCDMSQNFSCFSHIATIHGGSDECISRCMSNTSDETNQVTDVKTAEEDLSALDTSSSSYKDKANSIFHKDAHSSDGKKKKKRVNTRVVCPFALVKPGGAEGDMTINDINQRILMPPTRPVRHPVGDFACRPFISSDGRGLSGKTVVALTRIHTQGRGSITIIRTKG